MSAARTILTLAAAVVVVPLAMKARGSGTASTIMSAGAVEIEGAQATPADLRAFLEATRGANAIQCEMILSSFNSWSSNHAPDRDTTAWNVSMVIHRDMK